METNVKTEDIQFITSVIKILQRISHRRKNIKVEDVFLNEAHSTVGFVRVKLHSFKQTADTKDNTNEIVRHKNTLKTKLLEFYRSAM